MPPSGGIGRTWQSVRALPERTPLRVKMITAVLVLVAIALAVISFTTISVLRSYLLQPYDSTLENSVTFNGGNNLADRAVQRFLSGEPASPEPGTAVGWIPSGGKLQWAVLPTSQGYLGPSFGSSQPPTMPLPQVGISSAWLAANSSRPVTVPAQSGAGQWRVLVQQDVTYSYNNGTNSSVTGSVIVAIDVSSVYHTVSQVRDLDLLVSALLLLCIAIVGYAVVRASLRPLTDIEHTAAAIAGGDLSQRVPERDPRTEVGRLGRSLNAMLTQIETAFGDRTRSEEAARQSEQRMRQFVADASHELRTPLTAIRGFAEYYRQRGGVADSATAAALPGAANGGDEAAAANAVSVSPGSPASVSTGQATRGPLARPDLDRMMQRVEQESSRMGVLVEDMLLLARLDQQRPLEQRPVDLLTLAADAVGDARVVAPERDISLTVGISVAPIVLGDEVRLRQVVGNLMSNAISHTPDGTPIEVRVRSGRLDEWRTTPPVTSTVSTGWSAGSGQGAAPAVIQGRRALAVAGMSEPDAVPAAVLEVADHGPGLTPEQAEHVFERFYRADQARTWNSKGGAGLGLAIVSALVAAHGGTVWVESRPGGGAIFRIAIPLAPDVGHGETEPGDEAEPGYDTAVGYYAEPANQTQPASAAESAGAAEPGNGTEPDGGAEPEIIDSGGRSTRWPR
jgi:two-component system, OmpR family, sensor kinase